MEDSERKLTSETQESPKVTVDLEYFVNYDEKKEGKLSFNYLGENNDRITYEDITYSFYSFLKYQQDSDDFSDIKPNYIIYEFIRYFDGDGWIILEEKDIIFIDDKLTFDIIKIMIKATVLSSEKMEIKKKYENIDKEIDYIYNNMFKESSYSPPDAPMNLIVLTANPIMDPNGKKELRTMNDYNIITSKIYDLFNKEDYLKYTEFGPLTIKTLKDAVTNEQKRPVILHLICKSTYITPDDPKESENAPKLIFEKKYNYNQNISNYYSEFVDKKILKEQIFNYEKNLELIDKVKKITLIVSTNLAEYVYDMFKDFKFKNILIQHTTLADVSFVADFNKTFYRDLIRYLTQPINKIYEDALNDYMDKLNPPIFCCCFHKHKDNCPFLKNIQNELYNKNFKLPQTKSLETLEEYIPHFYHLIPDCPHNPSCKVKIEEMNMKNINTDKKKYPEDSFSLHYSLCYKKFKFNKTIPRFKIDEKNQINFYNICCCQEDPKRHNLNFIFQKDFSKDQKNNNQIRFRRAEITREKNYVPKYDKMELLIGNNKNIIDIIESFFSNELNINIFGDTIENLKKVGCVVKEYYLERYYFYESNNKESKEEEKEKSPEIEVKIKRNKSSPNLLENDNNMDDDIIDENGINLVSLQSHPMFIIDKKNKKINFIERELNEDNKNISQDYKLNFNNIYFIYVHDPSLVTKVKIRDTKIIWFSEKELEGNRFKNKIQLTEEPKTPKDKPQEYYKNLPKVYLNEYIKFQNKKEVINNWRKQALK